ncbi:hypothetical protein NDU88_004962 [Pleurodeles waltl]|uniref:Uncharacterized protein n=1 Tax=Pleurodeles waltl TaxID=8319 RepID=A0AAV7MFI5_PLEWA|nr:hypothetical protein NDU88_004962 [Pleurodeles waltl]
MAAHVTPTSAAAQLADSHPTDRILQEITAVGWRLEAMDIKDFKPLCGLNLHTGRHSLFPSNSNGPRSTPHNRRGSHCGSTGPGHGDTVLADEDHRLGGQKQERQCPLFWHTGTQRRIGLQAFLKDVLPELMGLDFSPPLVFQRAHRIGPMHKAPPGWPRPIIACFLRHKQACQVISAAISQVPYSLEGHEIRVAADFSRVTNENRK